MTDTTRPTTPEFLITKEYRRFAEFCDACLRDRYIGICHGAPGVGKTLSARYYAHWDQLEPILHDHFEKLDRPANLLNWRTIFYTPAVLASPKRLEGEITSLCYLLSLRIEKVLHPEEEDEEEQEFGSLLQKPPAHTELILIDEADRLKMAPLEQVRDIYDRSGVGVVLIGMPGLEKRLSRYPQLYSRVGFVHQFRSLSSMELQFILQHKWRELGLTLSPEDFDDVEVMACIARITNGNFRLIQRLFSQIQRIMQINHLTRVTEEVVEAARESLVIGPV
jgi:DNA transposition AAA+ family ATPase